MMNSAVVDKSSEGDNNGSTIMDDVIIVDTTTSSSSSSTTFLDSQLQQQEQQTILGSRIVSYVFKGHHRHQGNILVSIHHPSQSVIVTFCDGGGGGGGSGNNSNSNTGDGKEETNISSLGGGLYRGSIPLEIFKPFLFDSLEDGEGRSVTMSKDDTEIEESLRKILVGQQSPLSSSSEQQQPESNIDPVSNNSKTSGLHLSIQQKQKENDTMEDRSTSYITQSFELILGRTNKAGIVQHLYKEVMKRCKIKDSNNNNIENGTVPFCTMTGIALNDALRQIQQLKSTIRMWQDNSKRLDNQRQNDRDRLFENFNKLRLDMIQCHKKEIFDLQAKHDDEIRTINSSIPAIDATKTKKRRRDMLNFDNTNKDEEDQKDDNIRLPFSDTDGIFLKDGKATLKTRHQAARKRVLEADEATDMTKLYKEADDFARSMKKNKNSTKKTTNRMITERHSKKQQELSKYSSLSSSDSDSDVERTKAPARTKGRKHDSSNLNRHNKKAATKRNDCDSTSSSNQSASRQHVRSSSKTSTTKRRTARRQRLSRMHDSDSDTAGGEQAEDGGKKFASKNITKKTGTTRRQKAVDKSTVLNNSSSDTDLGDISDNNINSEDDGGESKPAPTKENVKQQQQVNQKSNGEDGCSSDSSGNFKW